MSLSGTSLLGGARFLGSAPCAAWSWRVSSICADMTGGGRVPFGQLHLASLSMLLFLLQAAVYM